MLQIVAMREIKKYKKLFVSYLVLFLILISTLTGLQVYCTYQSSQPHTYVFKKNTFNTPISGISINLSANITKVWEDYQLHQKMPRGAQYDGVLENKSSRTIKLWKAEFKFQSPYFIDSSWNGVYATSQSNKNILFYSSSKATSPILPNQSRTFGAVIYSQNILQLQECKVTTYEIVKLFDLISSKIILSLLCINVLLFITTFAIFLQTKSFIKKQELDKQIINQTMETFTSFIDAKDPYTNGHSLRVAEYSKEIATRMKLSNDYIENLY